MRGILIAFAVLIALIIAGEMLQTPGGPLQSSLVPKSAHLNNDLPCMNDRDEALAFDARIKRGDLYRAAKQLASLTNSESAHVLRLGDAVSVLSWVKPLGMARVESIDKKHICFVPIDFLDQDLNSSLTGQASLPTR